MIYKGKEYKEIKQKYAKKGDLIHAKEVNGTKCDDYRLIYSVDDDLIFTVNLFGGWFFARRSDSFKTYRYVKDVEVEESSTKKIAVFAVMEYSFDNQGLVIKKEVDRHRSLDRAVIISEGLNERNRKCFYSVDGILV